MQPLLKYRGGKRKEIPEFEKYFPSSFDTYYEPFVGGGAVWFHLNHRKNVVSDVNEELIRFYKGLKNDYDGVVSDIIEIAEIYEKNMMEFRARKEKYPNRHISDHNEKFYYTLRSMYNGIIPPTYSFAALYLSMNKLAYSGMIRKNTRGHFNVPYGRYKHFQMRNFTEEARKLIRRTRFLNEDFGKIFEMASEKDFIFCDPPYESVFHDYGNQEKDFGEEEHRRLFSCFQNSSCPCMVVVSKTPLTSELYGKHIVHEYDKNYAVNIRNRFKSDAIHIVCTNYKIS